MKTKVAVKSRKEAKFIARGLEDPEARAIATIMGILSPYSDEDRRSIVRAVLSLREIELRRKDAELAAAEGSDNKPYEP